MQPNVDGQFIHGQFKHVHGQYKLCSSLKFLDDIQFLVFVKFCSDVDPFCSNVKFCCDVDLDEPKVKELSKSFWRRRSPPPRLAWDPRAGGPS